MVSCTAFILGFSQLSTFGYQTVFKQESDTFSNGTMISMISLEDMTHEQAKQTLESKIKDWSESSSFFLQYQNKTTEMPANTFQIDYQTSLDRIEDGKQTELVVSIDEPLLEEAIRALVNEEIYKDINIDKLTADLLNTVKMLEPKTSQFQLIEYLKTEGKGANKELSVTTISGVKTQQARLKSIISQLGEIVIEPYQTFSMLNAIDKTTINTANSEAMNILATGVYRAILPTNFLIVERNISNQLPYYSEIGYEAKVTSKMDLIFNNPNPNPYTIAFNLKDDILQIKLIGVPLPYKYEIRTEVETYAPKTVVQFSALLGPTESKTLEQGKNGFLAKVYRDAKDENNQVIETTEISEDFYPPIHRIEVMGLTVPERNEQDRNNNSNSNTVNNDQGNNGVSSNNSSTPSTNIGDSSEESEQVLNPI